MENGSPNQFCFSDVYHSLAERLQRRIGSPHVQEVQRFQSDRSVLLARHDFLWVYHLHQILHRVLELDVDLCQNDQENNEVESSVESESNANRIMPLDRIRLKKKRVIARAL